MKSATDGCAQLSPLYQRVHPVANYSPWLGNVEFLRVAAAVRDNTLVDVYRLYELWQLVEQTAKLSADAILEVGAWRGGSGVLMAHQAARCGLGDRVYLCDTFAGIVKAGPRDNHWQDGDVAGASIGAVWDLSNALKLKNVTVLAGVFPDDTAFCIPAETYFRLVHIDVDVYESAADVLTWVWPWLVSGGVVVYDDYGFQECQGIRQHVDEQRALRDRIVLHNLNGHAVVVKR